MTELKYKDEIELTKLRESHADKKTLSDGSNNMFIVFDSFEEYEEYLSKKYPDEIIEENEA